MWHGDRMSTRALPSLLLAVTFATCAHAPTSPETVKSDAHVETPAALPEGVSPVQVEMRLLLAAVQKTVEGVAMADLRAVPQAFHDVHAAMEGTNAAVASGAWKPVQGDVARFEALDAEFHKKLVPLVGAARRNDVPAAADALAEVVRACDVCHREYRPR